jgi:hypothetical protein
VFEGRIVGYAFRAKRDRPPNGEETGGFFSLAGGPVRLKKEHWNGAPGDCSDEYFGAGAENSAGFFVCALLTQGAASGKSNSSS